MIGSFTAAARLPQTDRDHAALIGDAEGQAAVGLLTQLSGSDWQRPTDCTEWDVRALVSHLVRDLALAWPAAPVALELTGPAGGSWLIGSGELAAVIRAEATAWMRVLAGRDDNPALELLSGGQAAVASLRKARVLF